MLNAKYCTHQLFLKIRIATCDLQLNIYVHKTFDLHNLEETEEKAFIHPTFGTFA